VAMQCIGETFGVDQQSSADVSRYSVKPASLMNIFGVYLNAQKKRTAAVSPNATAADENVNSNNVPADVKAKAEDLKAKGTFYIHTIVHIVHTPSNVE
jgi:small glutamine-rich tetratricopeptide repeat-containing protein alpha